VAGIPPELSEAVPGTHPETIEQNRHKQRQRDSKRRMQNLVKNNVALDVKHCAAEVWLVGPAALALEKNNLASSQFLIFQSVPNRLAAVAAS
jgi:hypothetical protein